MRRITLSCCLLCIAASVACTQPPKPEKAKDLDKIESSKGGKATVELGALPTGPIAVVNGVEIPNKAFTEIYDLKIQKYEDRGREVPGTADRRYRESITKRLIWSEVIRQEAEKLGVDADEEELGKRKAQQRRGIKDWDKHLERRGETAGSLEATYFKELREEAILVKLGSLVVTDDEIAEDYDKIKGNWKADKPRVRASHVLVPVGSQNKGRRHGKDEPKPDPETLAKQDTEAKAKIDEVYALVLAEGSDFAAIAREHSTGPSAIKGGDIGIFTHDRMAEEFSETAFAMKPGEISKPVRSKFGWHIIKVIGSWPAGELPLSALEDQIRDRLRQRKLHQGRRKLKEDLLASYEVTDNMAPTLGPKPTRPTRPKRGGAKARKLKRDKAERKDPKKETP